MAEADRASLAVDKQVVEADAPVAGRTRVPSAPHPFPGPEPVTRPRPEVKPERWPREEPGTVVAPAEVVEPDVLPRPEPATVPRPAEPGLPTAPTETTSGSAAAPATGLGAAGARSPTSATATAGIAPGFVRTSTVVVGGRTFERVIVQTHWFERGEDLAATLRRYLAPWLRPGDHVIISETAVIATRGRMIPATEVRPGRLATLLARRVRPIGWGQGLSVPAKMQVAIEETGRLRILAAAAAAALTRPLGMRGVFYYIAGTGARSLDGMREGSPYEGYVIPPLRRNEARAIAGELAGALGAPVHIVDINDNGGTIRASSHPFPHRLLLAILRDNPLGQGNRCSPIGLIRVTDGPYPLVGDE
ncbi:MAG TPA: hypothetical protein VIK99_05575 [Thermaerobacter sp.]